MRQKRERHVEKAMNTELSQSADIVIHDDLEDILISDAPDSSGMLGGQSDIMTNQTDIQIQQTAGDSVSRSQTGLYLLKLLTVFLWLWIVDMSTDGLTLFTLALGISQYYLHHADRVWTSLLPTMFKLVTYTVKELITVRQLHKQKAANKNREAYRLNTDGSFVKTVFEQCKAGDIVQIHGNSPCPADLLIMYIEDTRGAAASMQVDSSNVDGESAPWHRESLFLSQSSTLHKFGEELSATVSFGATVSFSRSINHIKYTGSLITASKKRVHLHRKVGDAGRDCATAPYITGNWRSPGFQLIWIARHFQHVEV